MATELGRLSGRVKLRPRQLNKSDYLLGERDSGKKVVDKY